MTKEEKAYRGFFWSFIIFIVLMMIILFNSCSPKVIYVPEYHTEYITKTDSVVKIDSVHVKDSVIIKQAGDTIEIDRWHTEYKDRWRERVVVDSIIKVDSVSVPYPVEKKLSKWQQAKVDWGGWAMLIVVVLIFLFLFIALRRRGNRGV
jgi:uncharacterized BrkB/YihY/UPF0761 family membrane protein